MRGKIDAGRASTPFRDRKTEIVVGAGSLGEVRSVPCAVGLVSSLSLGSLLLRNNEAALHRLEFFGAVQGKSIPVCIEYTFERRTKLGSTWTYKVQTSKSDHQHHQNNSSN
jgi:hypothetical protein